MIFVWIASAICLISTLLLVSACIVSSRSSRHEEQFTFELKSDQDECLGIAKAAYNIS